MSETKTMTMDDAVEGFKRGEKLLLCEYRFGKGERIRYRDKVTGKPAEFVTIRHSVEIGDQAFFVGERTPDGFDETKYQSTIPKGTQCVIKFDRFVVQSGVGQFSGVLFPIVAAVKAEPKGSSRVVPA